MKERIDHTNKGVWERRDTLVGPVLRGADWGYSGLLDHTAWTTSAERSMNAMVDVEKGLENGVL